jgi:hypothetical protein
VPIEWAERLTGSRRFRRRTARSTNMGKGNNSQKNDKKNLKPKKEKPKPAVKK